MTCVNVRVCMYRTAYSSVLASGTAVLRCSLESAGVHSLALDVLSARRGAHRIATRSVRMSPVSQSVSAHVARAFARRGERRERRVAAGARTWGHLGRGARETKTCEM